jgi:hypothetical protein
MSAAHELLVGSRAKEGLPPTLEDERVCEQLAALLGLDADDAPVKGRRPERYANVPNTPGVQSSAPPE